MLSLPRLWESWPPWLGQDLGPCGFPSRLRNGSAAIAAAPCSQARAGCWGGGGWGRLCVAALPARGLACPASALLQCAGAVPAPSADVERRLLAFGGSCLSCCAALAPAESFLEGGGVWVREWRLRFGGGRV